MVKVEGRLVGKERGVVLGAAKGFRVWWRDKHIDAIFRKISFFFESERNDEEMMKLLTESNRSNRVRTGV